MRRMTPIWSALLALMTGVACAHASANQPAQTVSQNTDNTKKSQLVGQTDKPADSTPQEDEAHKALEAAIAELQGTKVFFALDDFTITDEGKSTLSKIADILSKNPRLSIRIEGNCDERGTEDYNLSLGQKRADAAKQYIVTMGAQDNQVGTISYGAERPAAHGHDESAWRQNRRDDVVVTNQ